MAQSKNAFVILAILAILAIELCRLLFSIHATDRRDPEATHLSIEIAALDAEHLGRPGNVALLCRECPEYVIALELIARLVQRHDRRRTFRHSSGHPIQEREIPETDDVAPDHDHQPFHNVAQFAHVPRPPEAPETGSRTRIELLRPPPILDREL